MINRFPHIIILLAALTGCFFFMSCENDMKDVEKFGKREVSVEEGRDIESILSDGGIMRARLTAPVMLRHQTQVPKVEFTHTLHVDFYDSLKNIESQLFAKYGEYTENQNLIFLRDSIIVFNIKGDTLITDELYWDQNKRIFYNDKPTIVSQSNPRQRLYSSEGLTADQNLQWFTLKNLQPGSFTVIPDSTMN